MILRLNQRQILQFKKEKNKVYPVEACALLFGKKKMNDVQLCKIVFASNILNSTMRFEIDPETIISALNEAENEGLVHKVFHVHSDTNKGIEAICNCCKCCCGVINMYYRGAAPIHTMSSYLAHVNEDSCIGCGTCVEKCSMETIDIDDSIAHVNDAKCIGCGVCAHFCPEEAINLERIGPRHVFIPPKKIKTH